MHTETIPQKNEPAIVTGIKTAGVGKKGSKNLEPELLLAIIADLRANKIPDVQLGAFLGGLLMKGLTDEEKILTKVFPENFFNQPLDICYFLGHQAPQHIKELCVLLIEKKELTQDQARTLGEFLLSDQPGDGLRGLAASILRVRYETADEYTGLLQSIEHTFNPDFVKKPLTDKPILQISEPFDGVDSSNMITPLVARYLQTLNYSVVNMVGRNSGPKFGNNLLNIAEGLKTPFLKSAANLTSDQPDFGWYIHQKDLSPALDHWVDIRRQIIKRPFLATLERFVNPLKADMMIGSAFHPPYGEKMLTVCERAGFPAAIIVRNGIEGTIAFSLLRPTKILCTARQKNGEYLRHETEFDAQEYFNRPVVIEEKLETLPVEENIRLIKEYLNEGQTHNMHFNLRIKATCEGLRRGIEWIKSVN